MRVYVYMHICTLSLSIYLSIYLYIYVDVTSVHVCMYIYIYICVCVCVCIYIYMDGTPPHNKNTHTHKPFPEQILLSCVICCLGSGFGSRLHVTHTSFHILHTMTPKVCVPIDRSCLQSLVSKTAKCMPLYYPNFRFSKIPKLLKNSTQLQQF